MYRIMAIHNLLILLSGRIIDSLLSILELTRGEKMKSIEEKKFALVVKIFLRSGLFECFDWSYYS